MHPLIEKTDAKKCGDGVFQARCPSHDDRDPSLSIKILPDGRVLIHCHAGCAPANIVAAAGLSMSDLFPDRGDDHVSPLWWAQKERRAKERQEHDLQLERTVLAIAAADRKAGRKLSKQDLLREQQAWFRVYRGREI